MSIRNRTSKTDQAQLRLQSIMLTATVTCRAILWSAIHRSPNLDVDPPSSSILSEPSLNHDPPLALVRSRLSLILLRQTLIQRAS